MGDKLVIRNAAEGDAQDILDVTREAFLRYRAVTGIKGNIEALDETLEDVLNDIVGARVFVALEDGVLLGAIRVRIEKDGGYIRRFAVATEKQKNGIGKALMDRANDFLKKSGVEFSALYTASNHGELVCFYYKMGYHIDSTCKDRGYTRAFMIKYF